MKSFKIIKRALKEKGLAELYIENLIKEELELLNIHDKEKILDVLKENYDETIAVNCLKYLKEDTTGTKLKNYLGIK